MGSTLQKLCPCVDFNENEETKPLLHGDKRENSSQPSSSGGDVQTSQPTSDQFERDVLFDQLLVSEAIKSAAVVSYPSGQVKAANFSVNQKSVTDIIQAFQGDTEAIAQNGITLSSELPTYVPSKLDADKVIYCTAISQSSPSNGTGCVGGATLSKTKHYVLITTFEQDADLAVANRIAAQVADDLLQKGH